MPLRTLETPPERDPVLLDPKCIEPGSLSWLLAKARHVLFPANLNPEWRGSRVVGRAAGRCAWPADVLFALVVLRWSEGGMSRLGSCRRARTDLAWRAAMGLPIGSEGAPDEKTVREFEAWLRSRSESCDVPRYLLVHEHIARLALKESHEPTFAMDSTPMWCFGALRGTLRLLTDGTRSLVRWMRRYIIDSSRLDEAIRDVAWMESKSAKGALHVDWHDKEARNRVVENVARRVLRVVSVTLSLLSSLRPTQQRKVNERCQSLLRVIECDLEEDDDGRLVVSRGVARDRIVSITDPEARSGRKTRSQPYKGFKIHVLGDVDSLVLLAVDVTPANAPEAPAGHALIRQARRIRGDLSAVLADTAYGATATRTALASEGIDLVAPPHAIQPAKSGKLQKHHFKIDFKARTATCPVGQQTSDRRRTSTTVSYAWPIAKCEGCPLAKRCLPKELLKPPSASKGRPRTTGRRIILHPEEQRLRNARDKWDTSERRNRYRRRSECELFVARLVRHGARQARAFGLDSARLQVSVIAIRCNLTLIAKAGNLDPAILGSKP